MLAYFNGRFMDKSEIHISPDDRGFLFADGVYEVVVAVNGRLFRMADHMARLERSLRELRIPAPDLSGMESICMRLLKENSLLETDALLYFQFTRGAAPRKHFFPAADTPPTVYMTAIPYARPAEMLEKGAGIRLVPDIRWSRCDIKSISLLPNVLASQDARVHGDYESVYHRDGAVTEGSHTNFAAVYDGVFHTYPLCHYILPGITRMAVLEICRDFDIPLREWPVLLERLPWADECMVLGSSTEVMPVVRINGKPVGDGTPGPVTRKIQTELRARMTGESVGG